MKKILEDLILIGNSQKTYKLFGKNWTFKTLTNDEVVKANDSTRTFDTITRVNTLRVAQLSRSIVKIDDEPVTQKEMQDALSKLQESLVEMLYDKYMELQNEQKEELEKLQDNDEDLKN